MSSTTPLVTNLSPPPVVSSFVDNNGALSVEGYRFLQGLWLRTGGASGDTINDNIVNIVGLAPDGTNFVFNDSTSTTSTSPDIDLTANLINITGTVVWTATAYDAAGTSLGAVTLTGTGNTRTLTSANFNANGATTTRTVVVTATVGTESDTITIYRLDGGSDAYTMIITNEAHTVPANSNGAVTSWTGASTIVKVYKGIADVTSSFTITKVDSSLTTTVSGSGTATPSVTASAMSADVGTATITATGTVTLSKVFTVTKAKQGAIGGQIFPQSNGGFIFRTNAAGTAASPTTMIISRVLGNAVTDASAAGTVWTVTSGTFTGSLTVINSSTGAFASFGPSAMTTDSVTFRCTVTDTSTSIQYYGDVTITKMRDPITASLTNDSINLPADSTGAVTAYTGATGTMIVSNASGPVSVSPGTNPTFSYVSNTGFTTAPSSSINTSGVYTISSGISAAAANATVTYRATYTDPLGGTVTVDKTFTIGKATIGATGSGSRVAYALYAGGTVSPVGGSAITKAGDPLVNTIYLPSTTSWTTTSASAWTLAPQTPASGQMLFMSVGLYDTTTNITTWQPPFLAYFKVGTLDAITANMGTLTAGTIDTTGWIRAQGNTSLSVPNFGGTITRTVAMISNTSVGAQVGLWGQSTGTSGFGVIGANATGYSGGSYGVGVYGEGGIGVQGYALNANSIGVMGTTSSSATTVTGGYFSTNTNTNSASIALFSSASTNNQRALATQGGTVYFQGDGSNLEMRLKSSVEGGVTNYGVIHNVSTTNYTIGVTASGSANSAASIYPMDMVLSSGEVRFQSNPGSGGQIRLKTATGTSGYGVILRHDGSDFYILKTASGSADSTWSSDRPFAISLSTGQVTISNPNLRDMTTATSSTNAATFSGLLPSGTAASTNTWLKLAIGGTYFWVPIWAV